MKTSFLNSQLIIALLLLFPAMSLTAQTGVKSFSVKKEFTVGQDVKLNIETSFGKVHCNVWDKNFMTIDVLVSVEAQNDKEAERLLHQIEPVITGNSSVVDIMTKIGNTGSSGKSTSFSIDYTIHMPRSTTISVVNRFGDVYIDESTGPVRINLEYGNLTINRLANPSSDVTLKFSTGTIHAAGNLKLNLEYSTLNLKKGADISSRSRFSTLDLGDLSNLWLNSEYDTYTVDKANSLTGSGKFSSLNMDEILQRIDIEVEYGGLDAKTISNSFSRINVIASFNSISLGIPVSASYILQAEMNFGECIFPKGSAVKVIEKSHTSRIFSGTVGAAANPSSKVTIKGKNSDVKLF